MQPDDQIAEWLVRWEEAESANQPPPALDQLPPELRPRAREGLHLLRGFARMAHGLPTTGSAPRGDAPPPPPDTPRYRFEAFLARGGMGEVWRGRDTLLARAVALKVLREPVFGDRGARARFEEEARHVGRLEHPAIVPVYDLGQLPDGRPFFVMKLIHGRTLAELLAARATPAEDLARRVGVFEQVCAAVAFAHARGLIHRDLKPSNVMLGEFGAVLVLDWGIAKALAARPRPAPLAPPPAPPYPAAGGAETGVGGPETVPGQARGTPAFMAPEQARGEASRVGKASDVFGLGGILCVTLTGQPPYTQAQQALAGDVAEAFARLDGCGADAALIALAKACLAPAPGARPADAAEVAGRLQRYRDAVAARQAQAERVLWLRAAGEAFPPAAEAARARVRQLILALLRAEVAAQARQVASASSTEATAARQVLEALGRLPVLAGVRNPAALANLPEAERQLWQAFWQEVEGLLKGAEPQAQDTLSDPSRPRYRPTRPVPGFGVTPVPKAGARAGRLASPHAGTAQSGGPVRGGRARTRAAPARPDLLRRGRVRAGVRPPRGAEAGRRRRQIPRGDRLGHRYGPAGAGPRAVAADPRPKKATPPPLLTVAPTARSARSPRLAISPSDRRLPVIVPWAAGAHARGVRAGAQQRGGRPAPPLGARAAARQQVSHDSLAPQTARRGATARASAAPLPRETIPAAEPAPAPG
jgi:tRNA A-37 threonylcarbamoyl transferase component Bud32